MTNSDVLVRKERRCLLVLVMVPVLVVVTVTSG